MRQEPTEYGRLPDGRILERKWWYDWLLDQPEIVIEVTVSVGERRFVRRFVKLCQVKNREKEAAARAGIAADGRRVEGDAGYVAGKAAREALRHVMAAAFKERPGEK